jgi:hypothetical protein
VSQTSSRNDDAGLLRELRGYEFDWLTFRDRVVRTLGLLELRIPCEAFLLRPSAEAFVATLDVLITSDRNAAVEFVELLFLAKLEDSISQIARDSREKIVPALNRALGLAYALDALPRLLMLDIDAYSRLKHRSRFTPAEWAAAYLSAYAVQARVLPLDVACRAVAMLVSDCPLEELKPIMERWKNEAGLS